MKTIMLILSVVLILLGLLMLLVTPAGFALVALGIVAIIYFSRKSPNSNKPEEKATRIPAPESDKAPQSGLDTTQHEAPAPEKPVNAENETFRVAGVSYHVDELLSLAEENPYYDYSKRDLIDSGLTDERIYNLPRVHNSGSLLMHITL